MQISMSWLQIRGEWIMVMIWIAISVGAVLVELATPTALISIWFAVGGVIGALTALINLPLWVQIVCFVVVSLASMLIVRPIASRYLRGNTVPTNADRFIGEIAQVTSLVTKDEWGEVKVNGTMWHAVPVDDDSIEEGAKVKVVAIEGAKLLVKRVSER